MPPLLTTHNQPPGAWWLQLFKSSIEYEEAYMGAYSQVELGVFCLLRVNFEA